MQGHNRPLCVAPAVTHVTHTEQHKTTDAQATYEGTTKGSHLWVSSPRGSYEISRNKCSQMNSWKRGAQISNLLQIFSDVLSIDQVDDGLTDVFFSIRNNFTGNIRAERSP